MFIIVAILFLTFFLEIWPFCISYQKHWGSILNCLSRSSLYIFSLYFVYCINLGWKLFTHNYNHVCTSFIQSFYICSCIWAESSVRWLWSIYSLRNARVREWPSISNWGRILSGSVASLPILFCGPLYLLVRTARRQSYVYWNMYIPVCALEYALVILVSTLNLWFYVWFPSISVS